MPSSQARSGLRTPHVRGYTAFSAPRIPPQGSASLWAWAWPSQDPVMVDNRAVSLEGLHEEEIESRFEATFAVGLVIGLQVTLALVSLGGGWTLIGLPGWVWLIPVVPEAALLLPLAWSVPRHRLEQLGQRRTVALALVGVITAANMLALAALIASLLSAQEKSGGELLLKGATIWSTNVITFGLLFWELDRSGPIRRREPDPPVSYTHLR